MGTPSAGPRERSASPRDQERFGGQKNAPLPDHAARFGCGCLRWRIHETTVCRHDHVARVGPICEQDDGAKGPTPLEGAEKSDEPEDAANDNEARLHDVPRL